MSFPALSIQFCRYAEDVDDVLNFATSGRVAGFLSESVQGVGGSVPLADGYLPRVYEVAL
jgi:alanine-glyoxylate transaminase/(R)-3-amino-2-methylpropionate-pyruvate transaminase